MALSAQASQTSLISRKGPAVQSSFYAGKRVVNRHGSNERNPALERSRPQVLQVHAFKFMKQLGLKKPAFLPDFGLEKRKQTLDSFFTSFDSDSLQSVVSDNFKVIKNASTQPFGKKEWITLVSSLKPSFPNFSWTHASNYAKDDDGYAIVSVQGTGHHTGQPWTVPGSDLPPVEASGKRFKLDDQLLKLKVEDNQITELQYLAKEEAGPLELYKAIGGKVPLTNKV